MRRILLFALALSVIVCAKATAAVSVEQVSEPEYMINSGYSEVAAEEVAILKNRVNGKPSEPLYEKKNNKFVRFCRNLYSYLDPSVDNDERIHHDIHMSPSWRDL